MRTIQSRRPVAPPGLPPAPNGVNRVRLPNPVLLLAAVLLASHPPAMGAPILAEAPDIPAEFRFDFVFTAAYIAAQIPVQPAGRGTALAYSSLGKVAPAYKATEEFIPTEPGEASLGRELRPRAGRIPVAHLDPKAPATVLPGMGAPGIDESVPRSVVRRNDDGTTTRVPISAKGSSALTTVGEVTSDTRGLLATGLGGWIAGRDADPDVAGNQGGLLNVGYALIGRSEDGPKKTATVASLSEHRINGMPSGTVPLAPTITAELVTTLGVPAVPKPGRKANVVFAFEGFASFLEGPLWSLILEYTPGGRLLSQFRSSTFLRDPDDPSKGLDDAAILAEVRKEIGVDANGRLSTAGSFDINDQQLFSGQVARRSSWDYSQRLNMYARLVIPEPDMRWTLVLAIAAAAGLRWSQGRSS